MKPRINKWIDLLDRTAWTFIQTFLGTLSADALLSTDLPWRVKLVAPAVAAALAAAKTVIGQNTGGDDTGAIVPGAEVVEQ